MLPLGMLNAARRQAVLVEAKSGETFNGTLLAVDIWMNVRLGDAVRTDAAGVRCHALREVLLRGSAIKCIRLPESVVEAAHEYNRKQQAQRRARAAVEGRAGGPSNAAGERPSTHGNVQYKTEGRDSAPRSGPARGGYARGGTARGGHARGGANRGRGGSRNADRGGQRGDSQKDSDRAGNA